MSFLRFGFGEIGGGSGFLGIEGSRSGIALPSAGADFSRYETGGELSRSAEAGICRLGLGTGATRGLKVLLAGMELPSGVNGVAFVFVCVGETGGVGNFLLGGTGDLFSGIGGSVAEFVGGVSVDLSAPSDIVVGTDRSFFSSGLIPSSVSGGGGGGMAFCGFSGRGGPRFSGSVSVVGISVRGGGLLVSCATSGDGGDLSGTRGLGLAGALGFATIVGGAGRSLLILCCGEASGVVIFSSASFSTDSVSSGDVARSTVSSASK